MIIGIAPVVRSFIQVKQFLSGSFIFFNLKLFGYSLQEAETLLAYNYCFVAFCIQKVTVIQGKQKNYTISILLKSDGLPVERISPSAHNYSRTNRII